MRGFASCCARLLQSGGVGACTVDTAECQFSKAVADWSAVSPNTRDFFVDVRQQLLEMGGNPGSRDANRGFGGESGCSRRDAGAYIVRASQLVSNADISMSVRTLAADVRAALIWFETGTTATEVPRVPWAQPDDSTFDLEELIRAIDCALDCDA